MCVLTDLADTLQTLLTTQADEAARDAGFIRRRRKLSGAVFVQTLVFGWLDNPTASLDELTDLAADLGADLCPQALDQRFTPPACQCLTTVLAAALQQTVAATPATIPLLQRFQGVYVFDNTTLSLPAALAPLFPGCGGTTAADGQAALKIHVGLELTTGTLDLSCGAGRQPDVSSVLASGPLPAGALRLADRGFFDMEVLQEHTAQGVSWITRVPARLVVQDGQGQSRSLAAFLASQPADHVDQQVRIGAGGRLPCRLLARRAPACVVAQRRAKLQRQAKKKGRPVSTAQLLQCAWTVYITNLDGDQLSWEEVWVLARVRWQIELLFKLWKSHGGLDKSLGQRPWRVLCEMYAKLLGQIVQHWVVLTCGGPCLTYSQPKAARRVRRQALALVLALAVTAQVVGVLQRLQRRIRKRCRVQERPGRPSTYQLLLDPSRVREREEQRQVESWEQAA
jgi:hypothetical protein